MTDEIPQCDHLILLVGGNPLPNAVAAQLLAAPTATIWLLHSDGNDGEPSTKNIAENLETFLHQKNARWTIKLEPIPSTSKQGIEGRIVGQTEGIWGKNAEELNGRVGLHYTGGTKSMSVHTYRALEKALTNHQPRPTFSYLDPRELALHIDGEGTGPDRLYYILKTPHLRDTVTLSSLDQLAALHHYEPAQNPNQEKWGESPEIAELARAMMKIHTSPQGMIEWGNLRQNWRNEPKNEDFTWPDRTKYPALAPVFDAMDNLCGEAATPARIARKLRPAEPAPPTLRSCSKWLLGVWLEVYAASCVVELPDALNISYKGTNLFYQNKKQKSDHFELDAACVIGYQLFAVSCIATDDILKASREKAKEHFLEVYVRARQLGGDEARAGLICLIDDAAGLENEIKRSWDAAGKVKVFGRNELQNLAQGLTDWFQ